MNRLTEKRDTPLYMSMWWGDSASLRIYNRLAEYENTELSPSEIIAMQSELTRLHNMLSAVSNPQENIATYSDTETIHTEE